MNLAQLPQVLALSATEKLDLIDQIWDSIDQNVGPIEISEEVKKILDERWAEHLADPSKALTLEQFNEALAQRLK